tara:strand:+ start:281 stop:448 length:168 start_codon:yes stop_codon:yes gene_type:complete
LPKDLIKFLSFTAVGFTAELLGKSNYGELTHSFFLTFEVFLCYILFDGLFAEKFN